MQSVRKGTHMPARLGGRSLNADRTGLAVWRHDAVLFVRIHDYSVL